ncbi:MAG: CDGSH iron-sulfur domain-containing protein [Thermoplasmatales archaeon]
MRIVTHERTGPYKIKIKDVPGADKIDDKSKLLEYEIHICGCGLSHDKPFCDGSHRITRDEDPSKIYVYTHNKERITLDKYYNTEEKI